MSRGRGFALLRITWTRHPGSTATICFCKKGSVRGYGFNRRWYGEEAAAIGEDTRVPGTDAERGGSIRKDSQISEQDEIFNKMQVIWEPIVYLDG